MLFNLLIFFSFHYIMVSTTALSPLYSKPVFDSFFSSSCGEINIILDCTFCNESIHYIMKRGPTAPKNETVADAWRVTVPEFKRLPTSVVTMLILCSFGTSIAFILGGLFANKVSSMWHSGSYDLPRLTDMEVE